MPLDSFSWWEGGIEGFLSLVLKRPRIWQGKIQGGGGALWEGRLLALSSVIWAGGQSKGNVGECRGFHMGSVRAGHWGSVRR